MPDCDDLLTQSLLLREVADPRNHPAWESFCLRYQPLIRRWCYQQGVGADETEELSQEVLVKLVSKMPNYCYDRERGRFRDWLRQVVRNHVTDQRRRAGRQPAPAAAPPPEEWPDPRSLDRLEELAGVVGRHLEQAEQVVGRVRRGLRQPHNWAAFYQTAILGRPAQEVARDLGVKVATVLQARHRVARKLREEGAKLLQAGPPATT